MKTVKTTCNLCKSICSAQKVIIGVILELYLREVVIYSLTRCLAPGSILTVTLFCFLDYPSELTDVFGNRRISKHCQPRCDMTDSTLSYDVASGNEITPCIKIHKPLVVYMFSGNVMQ